MIESYFDFYQSQLLLRNCRTTQGPGVFSCRPPARFARSRFTSLYASPRSVQICY